MKRPVQILCHALQKAIVGTIVRVLVYPSVLSKGKNASPIDAFDL
jgi:hypothetical protein